MEDADNELTRLPDDLRTQIINFRRGREIGLRELVEQQNRSFLDDIEAEMWWMLTLPGRVQPGLIMAMIDAVLSADMRKQTRINVLEANRLRIAAYKQTTREQEADIRKVYMMSERAKARTPSQTDVH